MKLIKINFLVIILLVIILKSPSIAQQFVIMPEIESAIENEDLTLSFELIANLDIQEAFLFYRTFGSSDFIALEMEIHQKELKATIPKNQVVFPYIEIYLRIITWDRKEIYQPVGAPAPVSVHRINIVKAKPKVEETHEQVIVLNPSETEPVTVDDFFVVISLLRVSPSFDKKLTRVYINDEDISYLLNFSDDLVFIPQGVYKNLRPGTNTLKVVLNSSNNKLVSTFTKDFQVVTNLAREELKRTRLQFNGSLQTESTHESMRTGNYRYNRAAMRFNSNYGILQSGLYLYVTDEEKPLLQPQNRYHFFIDADYVKIDLGDHYPIFPSLIMSGKRLRGLSLDLKFGTFNTQVSYGEINRKIEGQLLGLYTRDSVVLGPNIVAIDSTKYGQPYGKIAIGTYQRKLLAIRPYFGRGHNFQFGLTYLYSRDEMNSIEFGTRPKENVVIGSDLFIGIDNQRITLRTQAAFSVFNNDISAGNFSDKIIDSLFGPDKPLGGDPNLIKKIRDFGSKFITINQFLQPLNPQELPTFAGEAIFSLNYFGNYLKASYIYRGNEYTSFGQNFLRNDIAGFQLTDRLALFDNRLFLGVNYERLNDNLQKTKITTTKFHNFEGSISLYPRANFPNITVSYSNYLVKNDIDPNTADSIKRLNVLDDITHQISFSSNYDLRIKVLHKIFLNVITNRKQDRTFKGLSAKYFSTNFSVQSSWKKNLYTFIGTTISISELAASKYEYYSFTLGTRISTNNMKFKSSFSINPSFGNLKRTLFELLSQYFLLQNFSFNLSARYILNTGYIKNESSFNFLVRYEF